MNETKNQHYISCAEQRLNACNPSATRDKQRIYEFTIADREKQWLRLSGLDGRLIKSNLSMFDLFSFDVKDRKTRENFEASFGDYESRLVSLTEQTLNAHATRSNGIGALLADLLVVKFVNFIRNPFSVRKVLNTFDVFAKHHPTNPTTYRAYERTLTGKRPQQAHLCRQLGLSDEEYARWLRVLFMLLMPWPTGARNAFEETVRSLFDAKDGPVIVHIHKYDQEHCLLSDRGFSNPFDDGKSVVFDFNLCAHAFIRFTFLSFEAISRPAAADHARKLAQKSLLRTQVSYATNDFGALELFHRRMIEQAHEKVYCAARSVRGAGLVPTRAGDAGEAADQGISGGSLAPP